ncbi:MAG: heavy metal translocating P-type ATPase [Actinobacteria bacterium]|nr:heavy metal translocating P-type ATPase [Actinomycetota bacterium]
MKIGGMSCSFCVSTIERAYKRIPGVEQVGVSLAHEEGLVRYDPLRVSEDKLKDTLREIGYTYRDPEKVRTFEEEEEELRDDRNKLFLAAFYSATSLTLMALMKWTGVVIYPLMPWVLLALAVLTMFGPGWYIKRQAFPSLRRGILNQHVLLEFGAFGGLVGGFLGLFVSPRFPAGDFFAVSTFITTYHILSGYASLLVRTRSSQAVRKLLDLQPDTARVIRDGREVEVPVDEVRIDDVVRIRPGESVPVDGEVVEGVSAVNQSLVTGEPIPEEKVAGDEVIGGSINQTGTLLVRVTRVGEESFLKQVARSIEEARSLRPGILQLVDRILKYYVPGVLFFAALGFVVWAVVPPFFGHQPNFFRATFAALAVLVMGYPCALGMATPLAMIRGGGMAARRGILMRSGEAFQVMQELTHVVLDKTGTITRGEPKAKTVVPVVVGSEQEVLRLAAAAEASSEHPLARAVEEAAEEEGIEVPPAEDFRAHPGRGVEARVEGSRVLVGKLGFLAEQGVDVRPCEDDLARLEDEGQTAVGVAREGDLLGRVGISDTTKEDAAEAVARVRSTGLTPVMITGDNERTARAVAAEVGIGEVLAQVLPDDKAERIRELQAEGRRVAMVGDGINDAPALTQADVGIAIGAGTDIAIESADIVIMGDRLGAVIDAYQIGKNSYSKTKQNLALAFSFNGIGVPLAVSGLVHPVWAMVAMISSVTGVLANSFAGQLLHRTGEGTEPEAVGEHEDHEEPEAAAEEREEVLRLRVRMHCAGCAENIGRSVPTIEGVRSAVADHERGVVEVVYLQRKVGEGEIRDHLRELGYEVEGHAQEGTVRS